MSTLSGCPGEVRITTPPAQLPCAVCSRATGTGTTSRSTTSIALDVERAEMTARLSARAARDTSREVVTVEPFFSVLAQALASRTASSGVISTLTMPLTPRGPNRRRWLRDSKMRSELTTAPASTFLYG